MRIAIGYFGVQFFMLKDAEIDKNGRLLLLDVKLVDPNFTLLNVYNGNTKQEWLNTLIMSLGIY